jgi:hypothetical protein
VLLNAVVQITLTTTDECILQLASVVISSNLLKDHSREKPIGYVSICETYFAASYPAFEAVYGCALHRYAAESGGHYYQNSRKSKGMNF